MHRKLMFLLTAAFPILAAILFVSGTMQAKPTRVNVLAGDWQGTLTGANQARRILLHVTEVNGKLTGMVDSPDQNISGILVSNISFRNPDLRFEIARIESSYSGKLTRDVSEIDGNWKQGGATLPLTFTRGEKAKDFGIADER